MSACENWRVRKCGIQISWFHMRCFVFTCGYSHVRVKERGHFTQEHFHFYVKKRLNCEQFQLTCDLNFLFTWKYFSSHLQIFSSHVTFWLICEKLGEMPGSEVNLCYFHNIFEVRVSFLFCFCSLVTDDGDMQSLVKMPDSHVKLFYFHVLKF